MVPPTHELPADLARVLRDYESAWQARDPKALAQLFTEDGFVLSNGKVAVRGRTAIVEAYSGHGKFVLALRKVDGKWLIAADIDNSIRRAPKPPQ